MPEFGEELRSRFERIDGLNQAIGQQNQSYADLIASGAVHSEVMRERVTAYLTTRQTEAFTQLLETASDPYDDLDKQEAAMREDQTTAMSEIIDQCKELDAREAEAAEEIEHDRQLILKHLPELAEDLEELSSDLKQSTSRAEREALNARRAELEEQIKARDPLHDLAEKPWAVPKLINPADFVVAAASKGVKREQHERSRRDDYVDYFERVAGIERETDVEALIESVFMSIEPDKYSGYDRKWFVNTIVIDLNPSSKRPGTSIFERLAEKDIVLQRGWSRRFDENGKQIVRKRSVWRSFHKGQYDPEQHTQIVKEPGKEITWEPVEGIVVAKKEDEPDEGRDDFSREQRANVDREIRIKLTAYFRQHEDQVLTMEGIAEALIDSTTRSILEVQSIEHGEQSHAYMRNRIRRHLSAEQGELLCDALAKADRVLQYGWQQVKIKDSLDRKNTVSRRVVRPVSKDRLTWQHFDASELEGCRVDWEVTEEQRALAAANEVSAAAKLADPDPTPSAPPAEADAEPKPETLEAKKIRLKAETIKALNDFDEAGLIGGATSGDNRPAIKIGERLMIGGEAGPKIKGLMTTLRLARLSKHYEDSLTIRDLVRMRLSRTHKDEILEGYPGHGEVIHVTDCAITEFFAARRERERASQERAALARQSRQAPAQPWQPRRRR